MAQKKSGLDPLPLTTQTHVTAPQPVEPLFRAGSRGSGAETSDRCTVYRLALLWVAADDGQLRQEGHRVNRKRVQRYMREMGIWGIAPGPHTSTPHPVYPYLLKGVTPAYPNHVWGIDVTDIRLVHGWLYLVAILEGYSRYVMVWELSETLELPFVLTAAERALARAVPTIWNHDQGSHFTSPQSTALLIEVVYPDHWSTLTLKLLQVPRERTVRTCIATDRSQLEILGRLLKRNNPNWESNKGAVFTLMRSFLNSLSAAQS